MEIFNSLETPASKEFKDLLNNQLSRTKNLIEGKIIEGKVTKITEKFVFLFIEGLKSEPIVDVNELKTMGLFETIKLAANYLYCLKELKIEMEKLLYQHLKL